MIYKVSFREKPIGTCEILPDRYDVSGITDPRHRIALEVAIKLYYQDDKRPPDDASFQSGLALGLRRVGYTVEQ